MDLLHDVLKLLSLTSHVSAGLVAGGSWAVRFPAPEGIKFNAVRRGSCLLRVDGVAEAYSLTAGDFFLLTWSLPFTLASGADAAPVPAGPIFTAAADGVARIGTGEEVFVVGGGFTFGAPARRLLLAGLPPVVRVPATAAEAAVAHWAINQIDDELRQGQVASTLVAEHLAVVLLIRALRFHLGTTPDLPPGWLAGLADPVVGVALGQIHARPAYPWTVAELARAAAVSRSTLAARFKTIVGRGPLEYLTEWRIELAAERVRRGGETLATIAHTVGYGSESALSVAFKRVTGLTPRDYRTRSASSSAVRPSPGAPSPGVPSRGRSSPGAA